MYIGCNVTEIPANELEYHLKYSCESKPWNERRILVERARQRRNYPRPWGISINPESDVDVEFDDEVD